MTARKVRIAQLKVHHILLRCRKWRLEILQGEGSTSKEALEKLEAAEIELQERSKKFLVDNKIEIFDATREGLLLKASVFHDESDNLTTINQHELMKLNK